MRTLFAALLVLLVAGCANRQPTLAEMKVQSKPGAGPPFCLHIRYSNEFKYVFTQNDAEAWVTDGVCEADGPRRAVAEVVVRWRYRNDSFGTRSCMAAATCGISEPNVGEGKVLACVSGTARDGALVAAVTTDWHGCP